VIVIRQVIDMSTKFRLLVAYLFLASALIAPCAIARDDALPPAGVSAAPGEWRSLSVYPPSIKLSAKSDSQHLAVVATRSDGITQDVTEQVQWAFANADLVQFADFVVSPKADEQRK